MTDRKKTETIVRAYFQNITKGGKEITKYHQFCSIVLFTERAENISWVALHLCCIEIMLLLQFEVRCVF